MSVSKAIMKFCVLPFPFSLFILFFHSFLAISFDTTPFFLLHIFSLFPSISFYTFSSLPVYFIQMLPSIFASYSLHLRSFQIFFDSFLFLSLCLSSLLFFLMSFTFLYFFPFLTIDCLNLDNLKGTL